MTTATMPRTLDAPLITDTQTQSIRYVASHRAGFRLPRISFPRVSLRAVAIALLFFSAASSLTVGVVVLNWSGVDVIVNAGPIALIAAGGAAFAAMIIAINVREEN
jgi:hypothetical protein